MEELVETGQTSAGRAARWMQAQTRQQVRAGWEGTVDMEGLLHRGMDPGGVVHRNGTNNHEETTRRLVCAQVRARKYQETTKGSNCSFTPSDARSGVENFANDFASERGASKP